MDIGDALDRFVGTYSGGMKRRLDLAASLIHNPEVLFLDEPTTGLDPISRARVWEEVQRINKELSVTIFLTTQYLEEADALADRVGIINQGVLMAEGTPDDLKRSLGNDVIIAQVDGQADCCEGGCHRPGRRGRCGLVGRRGHHSGGERRGAHQRCRAGAERKGGAGPGGLTLRTPTLDDVFLSVVGARMEQEAE